MEEALSNFLKGILALEIGIILFLLHRRFPHTGNFVSSMTMLILVMTAVSLTFPLLTEHKGGVYFFLPIYLLGLNGWLFAVKHFIYRETNWQDNPTYKQTLVPWWILMGAFFPGAIAFVIFVPHVPNW